MKTLSLVLALALPLLFGCVAKSQTVVLRPVAAVTAAEVGKGTSVLVVAADERTSGVLGSRGSGADAQVSTNQNAADVLAGQVVAGLRKKGFDALADPAASVAASSRTLTVTLRILDYAAAGSAIKGDVTLKAALTAVATNGSAPLERTYRAEQERRVGLSPTLAANTRYVNEILSDVLSQLLNDDRLLTFLAR